MGDAGKKRQKKDGSPSPEISVKEPLLRWAMERSGKSIDDLSKKPQMNKLGEWLSGSSKPTLRQLEHFATATFTPFGYLFLSAPPHEQLSIPYFRTLTGDSVSRPSPNLIETVQIVKRRQDWIREYLVEEGGDPLKFVDSARETDQHVDVARKIRHELHVTPEWATKCRTWTDALSGLRQKIEDIGIFVTVNGVVGNNTHRLLDPREFRGFVLVDEYAPFIFVNNADGKAAQMFTLAHELAHIWLGRSAAFDLRQLAPAGDAMEVTCNRIAAELLVPEEDMRRNWSRFDRDPDRLEEAARHFKVSKIVAARRALDMQIIDQAEFDKFYREYEQKEQQRRDESAEGGNFYRTSNLRIGRRFARNVITAVREGKLLYREAYRLTGLRHETFETYAKELGGGDAA